MKRKSQILALLMALCLLASLAVVPAAADENDTGNPPVSEEGSGTEGSDTENDGTEGGGTEGGGTEGGGSSDFSVSLYAEVAEKGYSITADPTSKDLGELKEGYTEAEAKEKEVTVTIENKGASSVRLDGVKDPITNQADLSKFSDAGTAASYSRDALSWADGDGLVNGTSDGRLDPSGGATRGQAASILRRFCVGIGR